MLTELILHWSFLAVDIISDVVHVYKSLENASILYAKEFHQKIKL